MKLKNEKGAVTLFVLVSCLFFLTSVACINMYISSKQSAVNKEYKQIKANYEKDLENIDTIYSNLAQMENLKIEFSNISINTQTKTILAKITTDLPKVNINTIKYGWLYSENLLENTEANYINDWNFVEYVDGKNEIVATKNYTQTSGFYYLCLLVNDKEYWLQDPVPAVSDNINSPKLKTGMIPVKWNGSSWVKADETNLNNDWYDYSESSKKWANVVTVKASGTRTRASYQNAEVGTEININDITTMFVWIPRYAYKIGEKYHTIANGTGEVQIQWLSGNSDYTINGEKIERTSDTQNKFTIHPAFTADTNLGGSGEEITGFWVGKFESSNETAPLMNEGLSNESSSNALYGGGNVTNLNVTIRPNVTSWRAISVANIYTVCENMNKTENIHGLTSNTKTTLMQNSQWGAVAYLAQSRYGNLQKSTDATSGIWNNPYVEGIVKSSGGSTYGGYNYYATTLTGIVGERVGSSAKRDNSTSYYAKKTDKVTNEDGSISITYQTYNETTDGSVYTNRYYTYETEKGVHGSTTGTIYGIYDMSGGAWEYMASYLENGTTAYVTNSSYGFKKKDSKYVTSYKGSGDSSSAGMYSNYMANNQMYGDAVWETSNANNGGENTWNYYASWNRDYSYFPYLTGPFFLRGGVFGDTSSAGVFCFACNTGGTNGTCSFRVVAL